MAKSEVIQVRVTPETKQTLLDLAEADERTLSDYLRLQLKRLAERGGLN